jgi:RNA polymerase-interacting CarD/CdnL/TRCF family regulator
VLSEKVDELKCPNCGAPIMMDEKANKATEGKVNKGENNEDGELLKYMKERDKEREKKEREKRTREFLKNIIDRRFC